VFKRIEGESDSDNAEQLDNKINLPSSSSPLFEPSRLFNFNMNKLDNLHQGHTELWDSQEQKLHYLGRINSLAYQSEKILHGNPSGVDNTVSCYGGAVVFNKGRADIKTPSLPSAMTMEFSTLPLPENALRVLVVDTKVPRQTKVQVAKVRTLWESFEMKDEENIFEEPKCSYQNPVDKIFDSIEALCQAFQNLVYSRWGKQNTLERSHSSVTDKVSGSSQTCDAVETAPENLVVEDLAIHTSLSLFRQKVGRLMLMNHRLLNSIGVGHPKLDLCIETICVQQLHGYGKLIGAGGGGCAIVMADDIDKEQTLQEKLKASDTDVYDAVLGGDGVKIELSFQPFRSE